MTRITKRQYEKALSIVSAYQDQVKKAAIVRVFTMKDLVVLSGTIQVPSLTDKVVDDDFASSLEENLYVAGHTCKFISLDDMGFISISFFDGSVTDERIQLVLNILNTAPPTGA